MMAYFVKYLGKRFSGERIKVKCNKKDFSLKLFNIETDRTIIFKGNISPELSVNVKNYEDFFIIPSDGFWNLQISTENVNNEKRNSLDIVISES